MAGAPLRSFRTHQFKKLFDDLPAKVQKSAIARYRNYFVVDPFHDLLDRHNLHDVSDAPSDSIAVTIAYGYRAVGIHDQGEGQNAYIWYWCGSHANYNTQFREGR